MATRILLRYGFHIGGNASLWRPVNNNYLYQKLFKIFIFDLNRTRSVLGKALSFLQNNWLQGSSFVFVEKSDITKIYGVVTRSVSGLEDRFLFINRWYGGFFSNFFNLFPRFIKKFKKLGFTLALEKKLSFQLIKHFPKYWGCR
jgi:ribosomal protein S2